MRDLFAWTVREGVTNTVRHSRAHHCRIELTRTGITVEDDGPGSDADDLGGHGLVGLRERAAASGARVLTEQLRPRGFRLLVDGGNEGR